MEIEIKLPIKVSLNSLYGGKHFSVRLSHKQEFEIAISKVETQPWEGELPVVCHYHYRLKSRLYDVSNLAYMTKMIEDSLVTSHVLENDGPSFVAGIITTMEKIGKEENETVLIKISNYSTFNK